MTKRERGDKLHVLTFTLLHHETKAYLFSVAFQVCTIPPIFFTLNGAVVFVGVDVVS